MNNHHLDYLIFVNLLFFWTESGEFHHKYNQTPNSIHCVPTSIQFHYFEFEFECFFFLEKFLICFYQLFYFSHRLEIPLPHRVRMNISSYITLLHLIFSFFPFIVQNRKIKLFLFLTTYNSFSPSSRVWLPSIVVAQFLYPTGLASLSLSSLFFFFLFFLTILQKPKCFRWLITICSVFGFDVCGWFLSQPQPQQLRCASLYVCWSCFFSSWLKLTLNKNASKMNVKLPNRFTATTIHNSQPMEWSEVEWSVGLNI